MSFTKKDLKDVGRKWGSPSVVKESKDKKSYPSVGFDSKTLPSLEQLRVGDKVTVHAHARVASTSQYNDEPKNVSVELLHVGVKPGHNPPEKKKWIQDAKLQEGAFTAYCKRAGFGGVTEACILQGKKSTDPRIRKQAVLASTFRKLAKRR